MKVVVLGPALIWYRVEGQVLNHVWDRHQIEIRAENQIENQVGDQVEQVCDLVFDQIYLLKKRPR